MLQKEDFVQVEYWLRSRLRAIGICLTLTACQPPPPPLAHAGPVPEPSPINGVGYIVFAAAINRGSSALLIEDFDKLQAEGAHQIDLVINSPGGEVNAAQSIVAEMDRLHAEDGVIFNAYNIRLVASSATLVFLDAQGRYATPRAGFLFHAPFMMGSGTFSAEVLRKNADEIDQDTQMFRDALRAHTHLTKQQIDVYVSRTVVLSADDAQHDGVIDAIGSPVSPKDARAWVIRAKPKTPLPTQGTPNHPATQETGQG